MSNIPVEDGVKASNSVDAQTGPVDDNGGKPSTTTTTPAASSSSSTYETYIGLVEKILQKSRGKINTKELIHLTYGNDTTPFGGDDMLVEIMDGVLDKLAATTENDNGAILPQFRVECESLKKNLSTTSEQSFKQSLDLIDAATRRVVEWEAKQDESERLDRSTAREALNKTLVGSSSDVSVEDIVKYQEYQEKLRIRDQLHQQLAQIEEEADQLQAAYDARNVQVHAKLQQLDSVEKNLEAAADVCSMGFVQRPSST